MNYKFDSIVNKNEVAALKDMIFKRAQERSQAMSEDAQSDIMDLARDSFVSKNNPFSRIAASESSKAETSNSSSKNIENDNSVNNSGIGFPVREPKLRQDKIVNDEISSTVINSNMLEARNALSNKQSFMGALNFLNSQAAISLIKTRADRFEMIV